VETTVRLATAEDVPLVRDLMRIAFAEYEGRLGLPSSALNETLEDVAARLAEGGGVLADLDGETVGSGRFLQRDGYVYIGRLSVKPERRRMGVASRMMDFIEQIAHERGFPEARLEVRMGLPENVALYERRGYALVEVTPHPRDPSHMVGQMRKAL
jgi:ribosomal protein S18 acetylase RimI-like enzyme